MRSACWRVDVGTTNLPVLVETTMTSDHSQSYIESWLASAPGRIRYLASSRHRPRALNSLATKLALQSRNDRQRVGPFETRQQRIISGLLYRHRGAGRRIAATKCLAHPEPSSCRCEEKCRPSASGPSRARARARPSLIEGRRREIRAVSGAAGRIIQSGFRLICNNVKRASSLLARARLRARAASAASCRPIRNGLYSVTCRPRRHSIRLTSNSGYADMNRYPLMRALQDASALRVC